MCVSVWLGLPESRILILANGLIEDIGITSKSENTHTHATLYLGTESEVMVVIEELLCFLAAVTR